MAGRPYASLALFSEPDLLLVMNKNHLHSEMVDQDILLLGSENDAFQPPKPVYKQDKALINARSAATRVFMSGPRRFALE
jgi:hypothetical protein